MSDSPSGYPRDVYPDRGRRRAGDEAAAETPLPVLDIRLTALADAIRRREWDDVEREYDRVRSTIERELGVRERESDRLRRAG